MKNELIRKQDALEALGDTPRYPIAEETLQAAHEIINNLPVVDAVPKWISVKERLPELQEPVLFCHMIGKDVRSVRTGYRSAFTPGRFYTTSGTGTDTVTHWMPLPEPPKEEDDD